MQWPVQGLVIKSLVVEMIPEESKSEDGKSKRIAAIIRRSEGFGQEMCLVLYLSLVLDKRLATCS